MFKSKKMYSILLLSLLFVGGCTEKKDTKVELPKEQPRVEEVVYHAPLTGEVVKEEVTQRPIIVTVNNHPDARPQSGLASADIVYEMLAEGNVTRFLAVYQSELPETMGPVRSARDYFIELANGFDAFYIAHGYSPDAKKLLDSGTVDHINGMQYDGTLFKRSTDRVPPHNSYISAENVTEGAKKVNASMIYKKNVVQTFYEAEESVKIGIDAKRIEIRYGNNNNFHNTYIYDDIQNSYERMSGEVVTKDALTNEPLKISNVLFFEMPHRTIDGDGRQNINLKAGGRAYVFQAGYLREIQWKNNNGILVAVEEDGSPVKLVVGKTWVHFVPTTPGLTTAVTFTSE